MKCYDRELAAIREGCDNQETFNFLVENCDDQCFSTDMDQRIDDLITYGYMGNTAM